MPSMDKSPAALVARFDAVAARFPEAQRRLTFGYPCLYIGGNMVSGLFRDGWHVRLADGDLAELQALEGARPFEPMPGRPMTGFMLLPPAVVNDDDALEGWIRRAIEFGASRPAKVPKSRATARKP